MMSKTVTKKCTKCRVEKDISEFSKNSHNEYRGRCNCCREYDRKYKLENRDKINKYNREHRQKNKELCNQLKREYRLANLERIKERRKKYIAENPEKVKEQQKRYNKNFYHKNRTRERNRLKKYCAENKDKIKAYRTKKYYSDMSYRILQSLRTRVRDVLKGVSKSQSTLNLLGCTILEFRVYVSSHFLEGMNWDNYGQGDGKWNLDHIIPCAIFDFLDPAEQKQCFHFSNLRPLWESGNFEKHDKTEGLKLLYNNPTSFI